MRSITVTSTSARFSFRAAATPPKPPPTITTRCRVPRAPLRDMDRLRAGLAGVEPSQQVVADSDCVRHRGERGVHGADAREEARVDDVEVVELVGTAILVQDRRRGIVPESAGTRLMRDAR